MVDISQVLTRIDDVLKRNQQIETIYIILTILLFLTGIACFGVALYSGKFAWSSPSAITTGLLYWPLNAIRDIRNKNIALAAAPVLITLLPRVKAAEEIQKLLQSLYGENR